MSDEQVAGAGVDRIDIEVTTACNLGCAACPRTVAVGRGAPATVHMRLARFRRILENLPPARVLQFDGAGEPTLHPDFPAFVAAARATAKFGVIGVTTNGLARDPSYFMGLAAAGLRRATISVDTFDPAAAARLRAGTDVDRLARAVTEIARSIEITTAKLCISRLNSDAITATLARLAQTGVRAIEVVPVQAHHPDHAAWCLDDAARASLVARLAAFGPTLGKIGLFGAPALQPAGGRCALPERVLTVTVEGSRSPADRTGTTRPSDASTSPSAPSRPGDPIRPWRPGSMPIAPPPPRPATAAVSIRPSIRRRLRRSIRPRRR
ncbi:radical SAM protein [Methyloraptor flagellatus]|uniref:Radical SAM protein n=1 Tax=Methyloraptor flagellatus TaxID=3162530 RepID=A0AAU7XEE6_9HYPH